MESGTGEPRFLLETVAETWTCQKEQTGKHEDADDREKRSPMVFENLSPVVPIHLSSSQFSLMHFSLISIGSTSVTGLQ